MLSGQEMYITRTRRLLSADKGERTSYSLSLMLSATEAGTSPDITHVSSGAYLANNLTH